VFFYGYERFPSSPLISLPLDRDRLSWVKSRLLEEGHGYALLHLLLSRDPLCMEYCFDPWPGIPPSGEGLHVDVAFRGGAVDGGTLERVTPSP